MCWVGAPSACTLTETQLLGHASGMPTVKHRCAFGLQSVLGLLGSQVVARQKADAFDAAAAAASSTNPKHAARAERPLTAHRHRSPGGARLAAFVRPTRAPRCARDPARSA